MSLNSLAASRVAREAAPAGKTLSVASEDAVGPQQEDVQNALSALVEYLPAETMSLYLATVAAAPALAEAVPRLTVLHVYLFYACLTPILFVLIYAGKRQAAMAARWPGWEKWPWWPTVAATVAFLAWGLVVPGGPLAGVKNGPALGSLLAVVVSTLLGVVGRLFAPRPGAENSK